jgi:hypothetical protein
MTLLISSLRRSDVLLTADGRSTLRMGTVVTGFRDKTQKLFPVPNLPVVIGQHGQNMFHGQRVGAIIRDFSSRLIQGLGIRDIADRLGAELHDEVRNTLSHLNDTAAGIWVVGFGRGEDEPYHAEVFWKWEGDQFVVREGSWSPCDIIMAGDGHKGLPPTNIRDIDDASVETVQSVNGKLMDLALNAKVTPNSVGGHVHEVLVRPWGWEWTKPPAEPDR